MPKTAIILALILSTQLLVACGGAGVNSNPANTSTQTPTRPDASQEAAKDDPEELSGLVNLYFKPEEVEWKETSSGSTKKLLAVLRFTPDDSKKIVEKAVKIKPGEPVSLSSEQWFPTELVSQSDINGDDTITATAYSADEFLKPPYTQGRLSRVENTDFFVLELSGT